jgi:hypothetical protein
VMPTKELEEIADKDVKIPVINPSKGILLD